MSDSAGEKTEKPTAKRLEQAFNKGQIARSPEVQTVFVLGGGLLALEFSGREMWRIMGETLTRTLSHLHDTPLTTGTMQGYGVTAAMTVGHCVWPVLAATM